MDATIGLLLNLLDESFNARAWHGTNLRGSLRGITAKEASWRPAQGRHNIWEITLHTAYWKYAVRNRLQGGKRGSFFLRGSNWFSREDPHNNRLWTDEIALLVREHRLLREVVEALTAADLEMTPAGKNVRKGTLVRGIASHDLYHAGQIQLIKRLMRR